MSIEMFTQQLDMLLEKRKALAEEQERIFCEIITDGPIICHDPNLLKEFTEFHHLELEKREIMPHPCKEAFYYATSYKGVRIITYPTQVSPSAERIAAYASKLSSLERGTHE